MVSAVIQTPGAALTVNTQVEEVQVNAAPIQRGNKPSARLRFHQTGSLKVLATVRFPKSIHIKIWLQTVHPEHQVDKGTVQSTNTPIRHRVRSTTLLI